MRIAAVFAVFIMLCGLVLASGDRLGRLLLAVGYPAVAARTLEDPAWRGAALYQAGDYSGAIAAMKKTADADTAYNLGNAFARRGDLALAVKAYDIALKRDPADEDAVANRKLVLAVMNAGDDNDKPVGGSANTAAEREVSSRSAGKDDSKDPNQTDGDGNVGDKESGGQAKNAGRNKVSRRGKAQTTTTEQGKGAASGAASDTAGRAGAGGSGTTNAESDKSKPDVQAQTPEEELAQATSQWFASIPDDPLHFVKLRIQAERTRRQQAGEAFQPGGAQW